MDAPLARSLGLAVSAALLAASAGVSYRLDKLHRDEGPARYPVPKLAMTQAIASGFDNLLADGFWLQFLQYNGEKLTEDVDNRRYEHLWEGLSLITGLDPRFKDAYLFGAWVLGDAGDGKHAAQLVESGARQHPDDPDYSFRLGFVRFLFLKDLPSAITAFRRCVEIAPVGSSIARAAAAMAAGLALKRNQKEAAIDLWKFLYRKATLANDPRMSRIARHQLDLLGAPAD